MAIKKEQMTGRSSISYKTLYLEEKRKLEILEAKTGVSVDNVAKIPTQKEPIILQNNTATITEPEKLEPKLLIPEPQPSSKTSGEEPTPEKVDDEIKPSKELEIVEEEFVVEQAKADPNDFEFRCSVCSELFNSEGNLTEAGLVKCPDCGKEYSNG